MAGTKTMQGNYEELVQVFDKIIELYGREAFREQRRVIGCMLDLAPKRKAEACDLAVAYELSIPGRILDNQIDNKEKALEAVEQLKERNVSRESALVLVEALGTISGKKFALSLEHKSSIFIPYVTKKGDGIAIAIQHLDHIRWFLNHQDRYLFQNGNQELDSLRQMMYLPQDHYKKIREIYRKIVHSFQNDPYKATIILQKETEGNKGMDNGETEDNEITANNFGDYFTLIYQEPVPMSFACYYEGAIVDNSIYSWKIKKKNFCKIVEEYKEKVLQVPLPDEEQIRRERKRIRSFLVFDTIGMLFIILLLDSFAFFCAIALLFFIAAGLSSVYQWRKLKKTEKIFKTVSGQRAVVEEEIPKRIEEIDRLIDEFYNKKNGAADFQKSEYHLLMNETEQDKPS